jgi:hypothetical protein
MFFRVIAFLVGLIAIIAGLQNYDSELATASVPIITGGLVMLIAVFNLLPKIKRCSSCNKRLPKKAETCHYCHAKQPPQS